MDDAIYKVYEWRGSEIVELAQIQGERVTGAEAARAEKFLREGGWPGVAPDVAVWGQMVWAANTDPAHQAQRPTDSLK